MRTVRLHYFLTGSVTLTVLINQFLGIYHTLPFDCFMGSSCIRGELRVQHMKQMLHHGNFNDNVIKENVLKSNSFLEVFSRYKITPIFFFGLPPPFHTSISAPSALLYLRHFLAVLLLTCPVSQSNTLSAATE